jgi:hypothetical protein
MDNQWVICGPAFSLKNSGYGIIIIRACGQAINGFSGYGYKPALG